MTADFTTEDGTAHAGADYSATTGTLALGAGATTGTIEVSVMGDAAPRSNGTFSVRLQNVAGAALARPRASGAIVRRPRSADLAVGLSCAGTAVAGRTVECTVTVVDGRSTRPSVVVSAELPSGLRNVSNAGDCVTVFPCSFDSLPALQGRSLISTFSVSSSLPAAPVSLAVRAASTARDPGLADNVATASVAVSRVADLAITSTAPPIVEAGQELAYAIAVTNRGPSATTGVVVHHPTTPGLELVSVTGACTALPCNLSAIDLTSRTLTARYRVRPTYSGANPLSSTASTASAEPDPDLSDHFSVASTTITPRSLARDLLWHHQVAGDLYVWFLKDTVTFDGAHLTPSRFSPTRGGRSAASPTSTATAARTCSGTTRQPASSTCGFMTGTVAQRRRVPGLPPVSPTRAGRSVRRRTSTVTATPTFCGTTRRRATCTLWFHGRDGGRRRRLPHPEPLRRHAVADPRGSRLERRRRARPPLGTTRERAISTCGR